MDKNRRFLNKNVFITGATSGIGKAVAHTFLKEGAHCFLLGRHKEGVKDLAEEFGDKKAVFLHCGLEKEEEIKNAVIEAEERTDKIDVLVNAAGISPCGTALTTDPEDFMRTMRIDLMAVYLLSRAVLPAMIREGQGVIINIAGTYGMKPVPGKMAYSCAKAGVISLTKSIAIDFARAGIRCNVVSPGFVDTPLNGTFKGEKRQAFLERYQPYPQTITAEDIADAVTFLASDEARAITGQNIVVDGGTESCLYYLHGEKTTGSSRNSSE